MGSLTSFTITRDIKAPVETVWRLVADNAGMADRNGVDAHLDGASCGHGCPVSSTSCGA
jgi:uncharacterized protein YndB with AHSA1/START domain